MKTFWILVLGLFLCGTAVFAADAEPFKTKVNLVLDDGTIMLYAGTKKGVQTGDEYELVRNGVKVGTIKITKTTDLAAYGKLVTGDVRPMDVAVRQAAGKPAKSEPSTKEKPAKAETEKPKKEPKEKKEPKKETKKDKTADKDAAKDKDKEAAKAKPVEPPKPKATVQPHAQPPTALGLTGLMLMPTADVNSPNKAAVLFYRNNASDENLKYTDTMIGFTFGASENVEVGYVSMTTSPDVVTTGAATTASSDFKTNIISMKYQVHKAAPKGASGEPSGYLGGVDYSYAVGLQYFNVSSLPTTASLDGKLKATRFFLSASGELDMGTAHLALYSQSGNLFDGTAGEDYKGFGYQLGFEYPLGGKADGQGLVQIPLWLIAEYDDKPFYLGVQQAPSVGLRYRQDNFSLTVGMLDVSNSSIFSLGGSYHF